MDMGGGGGGGGVVYNPAMRVQLNAAMTVIVGAGGNGSPGTYGSNPVTGFTGGNSSVGEVVGYGGGGGGSGHSSSPGYAGNYTGSSGNGGGAGGDAAYSGAGRGMGSDPAPLDVPQGYSGGSAKPYAYGAGGGGGSNRPGAAGRYNAQQSGGNGGDGVYSSINGTGYYWGGGGGGASWDITSGGSGGAGGGGGGSVYNGLTPGTGDTNGINAGGNGTAASSSNGGAGGTNTGGGGGGGTHATSVGGNGGSGIVIIRYYGSQKATGGTITSSGGYTVHTFTSSGTFTPTDNIGARDMSSLNNPITVYNATYTSLAAGCFNFDGVDDYIDTTTTAGLTGTGSWTMEAWFKVNGAPSNATYGNVIVDTDATGGSANMIIVDYGGGHGGSQNQLLYATRPSTGGGYTLLGGPILTQGTFYQAVVVRNGSTDTKLYVNGSLYNTYSGNMPTASQPLVRIGRWTDGTVYGNSTIGAVKIYNKALTADEVSQNFVSMRGRYGI
jgi:hypothetical protein